ncbi:ATP-binding protein [Salimicrobium flavidum]|uniref:Orc1-like AAA ATPase domain-containing protein n=1 Tax=Salimicrobium flavidum TaxID=570947 RepID=A0A1N7J2C4_9BACI|nr:ATP-binding protein [Salimicrobium flavidum]SIS43493.1 hypothetical protein SAMN05421687_103240 [Salimicrobium flavidum]
MSSTLNPTAGAADPYWYEWSVGQRYIIDMLNPDMEIASVILQSTEAQGLDDVIVTYTNGSREYFQVKHTRNYDTVTFGNLVSVDNDSNNSLLKSIAKAWKEAKAKSNKCYPILFTNRKPGERISKAPNLQNNKYQRPALSKFWEYIKGQVKVAEKLEDVQIPPEWSEAWIEWCAQLNVLDNEHEKLEFLQSLRMEMRQPNLQEMNDELIEKLAFSFAITFEQARPLLGLLDSALRVWATTLREKEPIDVEEVYSRLSLPAVETTGEHDLCPPEPFFPSRKQFVDDLANELLSGDKPIVFLSGLPGIGKTSIVSTLANHREPVIDLRYHAFRPITPDITELPADVGETTKAKVLWGDLLSQLRTMLKGRLKRYEVPIRNEFLSIDELRENVLRLANELGKERDRPTIIAIDGIDHAARASYEESTFLDTLIPPDGVPENVRFFIIGQPIEAYDKYPFWLKDKKSNISFWDVTGIETKDIASLFSSSENNLPEGQFHNAVRVIDRVADGNTLSAIFAVHEARYCNSVEELDEKLENRRLTTGISAYYEEIWSSAVEPLKKTHPFIGYDIAGCFSLSSERVTGKALSKIFSELSISVSTWTNVLRELRPLVENDEQGFRLTHNDVRVHLTSQIQSDTERLKETASDIADYYWYEEEKGVARHADLFKLLQLSGRFTDQSYVFTPQYVMEAHALKRPMRELVEQCRIAVSEVADTDDWGCVHNVSCAVTTLQQLLKTVEWTGSEYKFVSETPSFLISEGRVPNVNSWSLEVVEDTLNDTLNLIESGELDRARGLVKRWFTDLNPIDLLEILPESDIYDQFREDEELSDTTLNLFRNWGYISQYIGISWNGEIDREVVEGERQYSLALASFYGGFLEGAVAYGGKFRWARVLKFTTIFFWSDIGVCLEKLAVQKRWEEVNITLLHLKGRQKKSPISFQIRAATYSLITGHHVLFEHWSGPIKSSGFDCLNEHRSSFDNDERANLYCMVSFVLGAEFLGRESSGISMEGVQHYLSNRQDDRVRENAAVLFNSSALAGKWLGILLRKGVDTTKNFVTGIELERVLKALFGQRKQKWKLVYGLKDPSKDILEILIECADRIGQPFSGIVFNIIKEECESYPVNYILEIGWRYLADRGEYDLLMNWFNHWCGVEGKAWQEDPSERANIVERLSTLAIEIGFEQEANRASERLNWCGISYTGHKEYVLDGALSWFRSLAQIKPEIWDKEGKLLLEISQEATRVGDNRISYLVDDSVAGVASSNGVSAMWRLYMAENMMEPLIDHKEMLFDGLIEMLGNQDLPEQEYLALWSFGVGVFNWENGVDRCYLSDLKKAIFIAMNRNGMDLREKLNKIGPAEFHANYDEDRYRVPERWFETSNELHSSDDKLNDLYQELNETSIENAINVLNEQYSDGKKFYSSEIWMGVCFLAKRLNEERPRGFVKYVDLLLDLVKSREDLYTWTYDRVYLAYKELIPLLTEDKRKGILKEVIAKMEEQDDYRIWLESISENLDYICLFRSRSVVGQDLDDGVNRILSTHEMWINGKGYLPEMPKIEIPSYEETETPPVTWSQFAVRYLFDLLKTDNGTRIEAALRGLWGIAETNPEDLEFITSNWSKLNSRAKEWVLLLAERAAISLPQAFKPFIEIVSQCYEGHDLRLKLQSYSILKALDSETPNWNMSQHPAHEQIASLSSESEQGVLDIPSIKQGALHYATGTRLIRSTLNMLQAATGERLREIERKYAAYSKAYPSEPFSIEKIKRRTHEKLLSESSELDRLLEVIYYELYNGRWKDIPLVRISQALTTSDDPFVLLKSPEPFINMEGWLIDEALEKKVGSNEEIKESLMPCVHTGLAENDLVLGAVLCTYSRSSDVKLVYDCSLKMDETLLSPVSRISTFNGRTFALFDNNRFDPQIVHQPLLRLTYESGGIGSFELGSLLCYPSNLWTTIFGWKPSKENPTVWVDESDKPVVRLEHFHGPVRDLIHEPYYRQPFMQRWVCSKEAFEEALTKMDMFEIENVDVEVNSFGEVL